MSGLHDRAALPQDKFPRTHTAGRWLAPSLSGGLTEEISLPGTEPLIAQPVF